MRFGLWLLLLVGGAALAEGSRELALSGGSRSRLEWKDGTTNLTNFVRRTLLHAYAAPGELIDLGSSAKGIGAGNIRWIAPDGATGNALTTCPGAAVGVIQNRTQEAAGPSSLYAGGYAPCTLTVGAGQAGIWTFEFISPVPTDTGNATPLLATDAWTEVATMAYVTAWDITVRQALVERKGRVYTNLYSGNVMDALAQFSGVFYVQTSDGFRYSVDPNALQPFGFHFFANNKGIRGAAGAPLYQSGPSGSVTSVQHPLAADDAANVTHKLFVNRPDTGMPTFALGSFPTNYLSTGNWTYAQRSVWLYREPAFSSATDVRFVGLEGTLNAMGAAPMGGFFEFTAGQSGSYNVVIDVNQDGVYGNGNDRTLAGNVSAGFNRIYWNGLDSAGVGVPATNASLALQTALVLGSGEVHFPYIDVENNTSGLTVVRENGGGSPNSAIYWNDTALGGTAALTGAVSSPSGTHAWAANFGNDRLLDTWALATPATAVLTTTVAIRAADLRVASKTPAAPGVLQGATLTWTVTVTNSGPSGVTGAVFIDSFPPELTGLSLTGCSVAGGGSCGSGGLAGSTYTQTLNLNSGATATLVFASTASASGTLTSSLSLTNAAGVQRIADMKDVDAFTAPSGTPVGTITGPVSTLAGIQTQCANAGQGTCNNLMTASLTITPTVSLGITKTNAASSVTAGGTTAYTVTVANAGPGAADRSVLKDVPSAGLTCTSVACTGSAGGGVCPTAGAGVGQLSIGNLLGAGVLLPTLPAGASLVFLIGCNVTASGS